MSMLHTFFTIHRVESSHGTAHICSRQFFATLCNFFEVIFVHVFSQNFKFFFGNLFTLYIILNYSMSKCVLKFVKFVRLKSRCDMYISRRIHNKTMQNPFAEKKIHIISQQFSRILCTT